MKIIRSLSLIFVAAVSFNICFAQTVDEIQAKYIAALGGREKIASLKNIVQEANMEVVGMQMPAKIWIVYGEASRQEVDLQGQKLITFIGKDKGWIINPLVPGSTGAEPIPDEAVKSAAGNLMPGGELYNYKENGYTATYEGVDTVNGKPAYTVKLTKGDYVSTYYLDTDTYYISRNVVKASVMGQPVEQTTGFSDYKKTTEGYVFPFSTTISNPMVGDIKAVINKIEVNTLVDIKELEKTN
ncbi:MAG: hypothetical protein KF862_02620 [Chitinophagaceae bacterium]|nr:hypothetical protein [Chitinophagaceae bacterium]